MADRLRAEALAAELEAGTDFETFFARAPRMNPAREAITGVVCGVRVETIEEPLMREIRTLDDFAGGVIGESQGRPFPAT